MTCRDRLIGACALLFCIPAFASAAENDAACSDGDRDVQAVYRQPPYYPHSALLFCISGQVKARFTIDAQGKPKNIRIIESEPEAVFDKAAADTIETWRFNPACRDGELADREAVQTIEFRLPGDYSRDCAETAAQVDEATARLLGDIGARYALLAQYWRTGGDWSEVKSIISSPFENFQGDLEKVAAFHRRALEAIPPTGHGNDLNRLYSHLFSALQPHALRQEGSLEAARKWMDYYRLAVDERVTESRKSYNAMASDYRRLERETDLEQGVLELLVVPFVGHPDVPFEEAVEPTRKSLDHFQAIIDFLESHKGQWEIADNAITFEHEEAEDTWLALWDDLTEYQNSLQRQQRDMLRSFQDYSD